MLLGLSIIVGNNYLWRMETARKMQLVRVGIFKCNTRCNKLKFVFTLKHTLKCALENRLLILVHLFLGNEHIISNSKDSEVATTSTISIYPGQDCYIASAGMLTAVLLCT